MCFLIVFFCIVFNCILLFHCLNFFLWNRLKANLILHLLGCKSDNRFIWNKICVFNHTRVPVGPMDQIFIDPHGLVAYLPVVLLEHSLAFHQAQVCLGQRGDYTFVIILAKCYSDYYCCSHYY